MSDSKIILAAQVEQEFEAAAAVAALADAGIAASYKPTAADSLLGLPGAMGCPESFDIFISENVREEAEEILASIGCIIPDCSENMEKADEESNAANADEISSKADKADAEPQTLNDLMPDNPVLAAVYKVLIAFLALAFLAGFVWLSDTIIAWFMGLFR